MHHGISFKMCFYYHIIALTPEHFGVCFLFEMLKEHDHRTTIITCLQAGRAPELPRGHCVHALHALHTCAYAFKEAEMDVQQLPESCMTDLNGNQEHHLPGQVAGPQVQHVHEDHGQEDGSGQEADLEFQNASITSLVTFGARVTS